MSRALRVVALVVMVALAAPAVAAPDEEELGKSAGYPLGTRFNWFSEPSARVGSFSGLDRILPHNIVARAETPSALPSANVEPAFKYNFQGRTFTIDDLLQRQRITGLLVIKDGRILVERYQYARTQEHRFISHSMAKSIVSLAVGLAVADGKISSLDDKIAKYLPALAGVPYGDSSVRDVLRMSSGVAFVETYQPDDDFTRFAITRYRDGTIAALRAITTREAAAGARFSYNSSETPVLGLLIQAVSGKTLSDYVSERLWQPMGAQGDATWITSPDGNERAEGFFNAGLRDYGRLGVLLANDGMIEGRQILPKDYLLEATDWHRHPSAFAPGKATPYFGYGYQFWTFPGEKRRFALLGVFGQAIFVDPNIRLVMVMTAVNRSASDVTEPYYRERGSLWHALVTTYGAW